MENNLSKGDQALSMIPKQNMVDNSSSTGEPKCPEQQQDKNLIKQNLVWLLGLIDNILTSNKTEDRIVALQTFESEMEYTFS